MAVPARDDQTRARPEVGSARHGVGPARPRPCPSWGRDLYRDYTAGDCVVHSIGLTSISTRQSLERDASEWNFKEVRAQRNPDSRTRPSTLRVTDQFRSESASRCRSRHGVPWIASMRRSRHADRLAYRRYWSHNCIILQNEDLFQ